MKKIALLLLCLNLTACSARHQFDCPYKEGARCLSVGEIDSKIDAGEIGHQPTQKKRKPLLSSQTKEDLLTTLSSRSPLRTEETVLTLWVAPFYTGDGVYHDAHRLHFVARESSWKGIAEIKGELL
jgi:type IV conjugative transfer system lipoprotein TraV